jgi:hypothetical protein
MLPGHKLHRAKGSCCWLLLEEGGLCPTCFSTYAECLGADTCSRSQVLVQVAVLVTARQLCVYDIVLAVRSLVARGSDEGFVRLAEAKCGDPSLFSFFDLVSSDKMFGVVPRFMITAAPWVDWTLGDAPSMSRARTAVGLVMSITQSLGAYTAADMASFFAPLEELAPIVSPLKAKRNADAAAALIALALPPPVVMAGAHLKAQEPDPVLEAEAAAPAPPRPLPRATAAACQEPELCWVHSLLLEVDIDRVLEGCTGGHVPYGFPIRCCGSQCEAPMFREFVSMARLVSKMAPPPATRLTAEAVAARHPASVRGQPPASLPASPFAASAATVAPFVVNTAPVTRAVADSVPVAPPTAYATHPAAQPTAVAWGAVPGLVNVPQSVLYVPPVVSFHSVSPLAAGTSLVYVAAGSVAGGQVKNLKCAKVVRSADNKEKNVKWSVMQDTVKLSSITSGMVDNVTPALFESLAAFEARVSLSAGMPFAVPKARPLIEKFRRLVRERGPTGVDPLVVSTFDTAYNKCLNDTLRYFCRPDPMFDMTLEEYLSMIVQSPIVAPVVGGLCQNFNSASGCSNVACSRSHTCSVRLPNGSICGGDHSKTRHPA